MNTATIGGYLAERYHKEKNSKKKEVFFQLICAHYFLWTGRQSMANKIIDAISLTPNSK